MLWILKNFSSPHCQRAFTVPGSFKASCSSSSFSLSLHSIILMIKYLHWDNKRELASSFDALEKFYWLNACKDFLVFGYHR
jgi:hypothetical protein